MGAAWLMVGMLVVSLGVPARAQTSGLVTLQGNHCTQETARRLRDAIAATG